MCAFVLSELEYCNSLLSGSPRHFLGKLQRIRIRQQGLSGNQESVTTYSLFSANFTGYQFTEDLIARFRPCASTLSSTLLLFVSRSFSPHTPFPDISVHPKTHLLSAFRLLRPNHLVTVLFPLQALLSGTLTDEVCHSQSASSFTTDLKTCLFQSAYFRSVSACHPHICR